MLINFIIKYKDVLIKSIYEYRLKRCDKISFNKIILIIFIVKLFAKIFFNLFIKVFYKCVLLKRILVFLITLLIIRKRIF